MDYVNDANELVRRLRAFAFGSSAPKELEQKLQTLPGVAADVLCDGAELLYAHRDLLNEQGLELMGQMFLYAKEQGWTTFNQGERSAEIVALTRRDLGEKGASVAKKADEWPKPQVNRREDGTDWRNPSAETELSDPTPPAEVKGAD